MPRKCNRCRAEIGDYETICDACHARDRNVLHTKRERERLQREFDAYCKRTQAEIRRAKSMGDDELANELDLLMFVERGRLIKALEALKTYSGTS